MFFYLLNIVLISLLYNNPFITAIVLLSLLLVSFLTKREKFWSYFKFSGLVFLITVAFNLILNQRGINVLVNWKLLKITTESLQNGIVLGIAFVNLLWAFYVYDSLARTKVIFEILSNLFKSIAIIFILTLKFIPEIIQVYTETKALKRFRTQTIIKGIFDKVKQTMDLTEIVLNKSIAKFMNVSDTLILKGYERRQRKLGKVYFKRIDVITLSLIVMSIMINIFFVVNKIGQINFGSAEITVTFNRNILINMVLNCILILFPLLIGGINYGWWKFYTSKTTASATITAKSYR